jgi:hypothetical protein
MSALARSRLDAWLPAALLAVGSAAFLGAGSQHPHIGAGLGPVGSDEYFRAFAERILHIPDWETMHGVILAGPLLWALAAAGTSRLLPARAAALGDVGRGALLLAAAFWAVAFVLDGFVAPKHASAVMAAHAGADGVALAAFGVSQLTMARLGMISVVLMGTAIFAFGAALLLAGPSRSWRATVGGAGLIVGAWPAVAALRGDFSPGPFTSPYWTLTALSLGLWFLALATALPGLRATVVGSHAAAHPTTGPVPA